MDQHSTIPFYRQKFPDPLTRISLLSVLSYKKMKEDSITLMMQN